MEEEKDNTEDDVGDVERLVVVAVSIVLDGVPEVVPVEEAVVDVGEELLVVVVGQHVDVGPSEHGHGDGVAVAATLLCGGGFEIRYQRSHEIGEISPQGTS